MATSINGRLQSYCVSVRLPKKEHKITVSQGKSRKTAAPGRLIGYARVSTEEQGTDPQVDELRAAGCASILEEHASGAGIG